MGAGSAWFVAVVGCLGLVLALHQLGVNAGSDLGTMLRSTVRVLGQPL